MDAKRKVTVKQNDKRVDIKLGVSNVRDEALAEELAGQNLRIQGACNRRIAELTRELVKATSKSGIQSLRDQITQLTNIKSKLEAEKADYAKKYRETSLARDAEMARNLTCKDQLDDLQKEKAGWQLVRARAAEEYAKLEEQVDSLTTATEQEKFAIQKAASELAKVAGPDVAGASAAIANTRLTYIQERVRGRRYLNNEAIESNWALLEESGTNVWTNTKTNEKRVLIDAPVVKQVLGWSFLNLEACKNTPFNAPSFIKGGCDSVAPFWTQPNVWKIERAHPFSIDPKKGGVLTFVSKWLLKAAGAIYATATAPVGAVYRYFKPPKPEDDVMGGWEQIDNLLSAKQAPYQPMWVKRVDELDETITYRRPTKDWFPLPENWVEVWQDNSFYFWNFASQEILDSATGAIPVMCEEEAKARQDLYDALPEEVKKQVKPLPAGWLWVAPKPLLVQGQPGRETWAYYARVDGSGKAEYKLPVAP